MPPFTQGALIPLEGGGSEIWFQWNPANVDEAHKAEYAEIKVSGRDSPFLEYSNGATTTYSFDLDISRSDNGDDYVQSAVQSLVQMTKATVQGQGVNRPPRVLFVFGSLFSKECVVAEANPKYWGQFNPITLMPYQATVHVVLNEYTDDYDG